MCERKKSELNQVKTRQKARKFFGTQAAHSEIEAEKKAKGENPMARIRDLTDLISSQPSCSYLNRALAMNWQWHAYERDGAEMKNAKQLRLARETQAQRYGVQLRFFGD